MVSVSKSTRAITRRQTASRRVLAARKVAPRKPLWFDVLFAAGCVARGTSATRPISWAFDGEQAFYTNPHSEAVVVTPFDVCLGPGESLAIGWNRGETGYSLHHAI